MEELADAMYNMLESIRIVAMYMAPFMPESSAEVFKCMGQGDIFAIENIQDASK